MKKEDRDCVCGGKKMQITGTTIRWCKKCGRLNYPSKAGRVFRSPDVTEGKLLCGRQP